MKPPWMQMICPKCEELGLKSSSHVQTVTRTLMAYEAYYDEGGSYHIHDPNSQTTWFNCSQAHNWKSITYTACSSCGFDSGQDKKEVIEPKVEETTP